MLCFLAFRLTISVSDAIMINRRLRNQPYAFRIQAEDKYVDFDIDIWATIANEMGLYTASADRF